jgi:hypothetical protein
MIRCAARSWPRCPSARTTARSRTDEEHPAARRVGEDGHDSNMRALGYSRRTPASDVFSIIANHYTAPTAEDAVAENMLVRSLTR